MTLFVDASALVAIIAEEPDQHELARQIHDDPDPLWSAMTGWEAVVSLERSCGWRHRVARAEVEAFAAARPLRLVEIGEIETDLAVEAFRRYGKGRHRASLNMGDCFAYACAKANNARLLYKGNDFVHTDLG
jgi:ribonuclease VapC